jgi:phage gp16-like protein
MQSETNKNRRKKLIQLIHIGKAKMALTDEGYRAFLDGACGKDSAALMTIRELESVLKAMREQGFEQKPCRVKPEEKGGATMAQLEYIKGMWQKCARNKSDEALSAFVNRIASVKSLRFLTVATARMVILALRDMSAKAGVKAGFDPGTSDRMSAEARGG